MPAGNVAMKRAAASIERSPEFGAARDGDGAPLLRADSDRESVFVLLGRYRDVADALPGRHGGSRVEQSATARSSSAPCACRRSATRRRE